MKIKIPELALITLIGSSSSGKSTFAKRFFKASEIVSSDACRTMVCDDENSLEATTDAFELAHFIIDKRLKKGFLTVIDATNTQVHARKPLIQLCKKNHVMPIAIVLDTTKTTCKERNEERTDRNLEDYVIDRQFTQLQKSIKRLKNEGFRTIYKITPEELENLEIEREPLYNNKKEISGPFDIIGDVHGCLDELILLLEKLNYTVEKEGDYGYTVSHPENRKVIFVGDLVDRGPKSNEVLRLAMSMVKNEIAYAVCGNHDFKLAKKLNGKNVSLTHGLGETVEQLATESKEFIEEVRIFLNGLISHYLFDEGKLVIAHAGLKEEMHGKTSGEVRSFCMYGDTNGETDEYGLPVRLNWANEYKGKAVVVYGHTPVSKAIWENNTIDIDTACVFGGSLTALSYPEKKMTSVDAKKMYSEPSKPLTPLTIEEEDNGMVHYKDVSGKQIIQTRLLNKVAIMENNAIQALETMSRFAISPNWLTYLPPTMSPCETSKLADYLEHPQEAFDYFKENSVEKIICEEKHMGSRAVITICQNSEIAKKRFDANKNEIGVIYTRTGRAFFNNESVEKILLSKIQEALTKTNFWGKFQTQWVTLDCELMPWSEKAKSLVLNQYASNAVSGKIAITSAEQMIQKAMKRGIDMQNISSNIQDKKESNTLFTNAYREYCWNINSIEDYKIAPFHILATEGKVHIDKNHEWHMKTISDFCQESEILMATNYQIIDVNDLSQQEKITNWWLELTKNGGEGMVVKPYDFIVTTEKGFIQPAIKCRGKEYLRIIYGAEYTFPENLEKLKRRNVKGKQRLASREFALGIEALERFVNKQPLRKYHQCVFGILALESEPIDPRL